MTAQDRQELPPIFQRIKDYILGEIRSGNLLEGDLIPTELALAAQFNVARMTVNRALRELTAEQILVRVQGSGTYVAQQKYQATLVTVKNIAEEIRNRGHIHKSTLHTLEQKKATLLLTKQFELHNDAILFHSVIVHFENEIPIQVEDRWVNPNIAPDYLLQDFSKITPNEYLMATAPLHAAEYSIEACVPTRKVAKMLAIELHNPCLVLKRRTHSNGHIASVAAFWYPGHRYRFAGSFS